jgi:inosine-uridine nucleoside N-ribohydrolase
MRAVPAQATSKRFWFFSNLTSLVCLPSPVSGDQWVKEETQHALRTLEIAGHTDVPVIQGAEFPLLNSKEETERWEELYGKLEYKGCWTEHFEATRDDASSAN